MNRITIKYRLKPTAAQEILLREHCGAQRFIWNQMLEANKKRYEEEEKLFFFNDMHHMTRDFKHQEGMEWLKDINSQTVQGSCKRLDQAMKRSFKGANAQAGFPKFKSKHSQTQFFDVPQNTKVENKYVKLPKIPPIKAVIHRPIPGKIKSAVVKFDGLHWYACIVCEIKPTEPKTEIRNAVGIDVGITTFVALSDGQEVEFEHDDNFEKRKRRRQKSVARKEKGSANYAKAVEELRKLYRKEANQRTDFHHKMSTAIAKQYDLVVIEDLNVKGMIKNPKLAKHIQRQGFGQFFTMLAYKCRREGSYLIKIGRFFPSSQLCSYCGWRKTDLKLSDRIWECSSCGTSHDRDLNAALNIRNEGLRKLRQELPDVKPVENLLDELLSYESSEQSSVKQEATNALALW